MEPSLDTLQEPCAVLQSHEVHDFLQDLLTPDEISRLAKRWQVMKLLAHGYSPTEVHERTGASRTTIARAHRVVRYGTGIIREIEKRITAASNDQDQA